MHASSFRSKLFASLKRFVRACPVQCQYLIPTVLNLWQCHPPTFLRLLPGQWITSIYFPIHGLKPLIIPNFPGKLHAVKLFPKSCFTIDLTQMKWYIKGAVSWRYSSFCLILLICYFCDFCDICGGLGPFLVSSFSKSRIFLNLLFFSDFCDICHGCF